MATTEELIALQSAEPPSGPVKRPSMRQPKGMVRILGMAGLTMALALPIGVFPRVTAGQKLQQEHAEVVSRLPQVSVIKPVLADPDRKVRLPGTVEALQAAPLFARADGYIKSRLVDIGDRVQPGQLLADIETPEVDESAKEARAGVLTQVAARAQSQANLDKARADLDATVAQLAQSKANLIERQSNQHFALISHDRWLTLAEQGAVSAHESDEKLNNYKMSKAATVAAEEQIHSLESQVVAARARVKAEMANVAMSQANIDAAIAKQNRTETEQHFNKLVAPFAGVITERNIEAGNLITAGSENSKQPLYRIARIDTVKVFVDVPQYVSRNVKEGLSVEVALRELPGQTFSGRVVRTSVALDALARTLKTEIHIPNQKLLLTPGMYADATFAVPRSTKTFLVPSNALVSGGDGTQLVLAEGDKIIFRKVQVGDDLGKQIEIVSGLCGSENVVINPADTLTDGTRIAMAPSK